MFKNIFVTITFFLFLQSCSHYGNKNAKILVKTDVIGLSKNELIEKYDKPTSNWLNENEKLVYEYRYTSNYFDIFTHIPIVCIFFGGTNRDYYSSIITFNNTGKIIKQKNMVFEGIKTF